MPVQSYQFEERAQVPYRIISKLIQTMIMRHTNAAQFNGQPVLTLPGKNEETIMIDFEPEQVNDTLVSFVFCLTRRQSQHART